MLSEYRPWPARQLVYDARSNIPLCQISISSFQMPRGPLELRAKGNFPKASAKIWRDDPGYFAHSRLEMRSKIHRFGSFERPFPSTINALGKAQIQLDGAQIQLGFAITQFGILRTDFA
jgi:hypothetical protein